jgi:hypothetical protein
MREKKIKYTQLEVFMKLTVLFFLVLIQMLLTVGCDTVSPVKTNETVTLTPEPGSFGVGYMKGLSKSKAAANVQSGANISFDLGSIKGSNSFYFLLYNIGGTPITDVTLEMDDSNFTVYPSAMDTLTSGNDVGVLPVVKISAIHGTALDGYGFRPLMHKGKNTGHLLVSGKTKTSNGNDTSVTLLAELNLNALVMDIVVQCGLDTVNLIQTNGDFCGFLGSYPFDGYEVVNMRGFGNSYKGDSISITNTGNVSITLRMLYIDEFIGTIIDTLQYTIDTLQKVVVSRGQSSIRPMFCLDGNNTIADHSRLPLQQNGKCYFQWFPFQSTVTLDLDSFKNLALVSSCSSNADSFFLIDSVYVFWKHNDNCSDSNYSFTLFSVYSVDSILCRISSSIEGPVEQYTQQYYHDMLDKIINNLSLADFGLGNDHKVDIIQ